MEVELLSPEQVDAVSDKISVPGSRCTVQTTRNIIATLRQAWLDLAVLSGQLREARETIHEFEMSCQSMLNVNVLLDQERDQLRAEGAVAKAELAKLKERLHLA